MGLVEENGEYSSMPAADLPMLCLKFLEFVSILLLCRASGEDMAPATNVDPGAPGSMNLEAQLSGIDLNPSTVHSGIHGPPDLASDIQGSSSRHLASDIQGSSSQH